MTDRSGFRFRVPRLRPSVPPPRPTTTPRTPARRLPVRPLPQPSTTQPAPTTPPPIRPQGTSPSPTPPPSTSPLPNAPPPTQPQGTSLAPPPALPLPAPTPAPAPTPTPAPSTRPQGTSLAPPPALSLPAPAPTPTPTSTPTTAPSTRPQGTSPTPESPLRNIPSPSLAPVTQEQLVPQERPASPPVGSLGAAPTSPPELPVGPLPAQQEPLVEPSPTRQDEPAPMAPTPIQTVPPISPVTTKPPSPSKKIQPTSQASSPQHGHPSQLPEIKMPTNNHQKDANGNINATPNEERREITSDEQSSEHSSSESHTEQNQNKNQEATNLTNNIPNTPQTKSMISHPDDKIPVPESPKIRKTNGPQHPKREDTTSENPTDHVLNGKPAIITLAGDNKGTSMRIGSGAKKQEKSIHIYRKYKANPDEIADTTTDEEEKENDSKANESEESFSYINCNVQGINNSVVFNCAITERSPGVHLGSCDQENVKKPKKKYIKPMDMNKVKVNSTPSKKYTIRRRCLRGLFMESSESDTNDPQKPRRHGCRYVCGDKSNKDDKMDAV